MELQEIVRAALAEDVGSGDATTLATVDPAARARATITQKAPGVVFGFDAAEATFPEYVERPRAGADDAHVTFSEAAGRGFYEQIEQAIESGDEQPLIDFSRMPKDWAAPAARPRTGRH